MRRFISLSFGAGALLLCACANPVCPEPLVKVEGKAQDICPPGSGIVIRTGVDGQLIAVCEPL